MAALRNLTMPPPLEPADSERGIMLQIEGERNSAAAQVPEVDEGAAPPQDSTFNARGGDGSGAGDEGDGFSRRGSSDSMAGLAHTYADLLMQKEADIQEQQDEIQALRLQLGTLRDKVRVRLVALRRVC